MNEQLAAAEVALDEPPLSEYARIHVLKQDDLFAVFNPRGDFHGQLHPVGPSTGADGLFQDDTRILSELSLTIGGAVPVLLSSSVGLDNVVFSANLSNPPLVDATGRPVAGDRIYIGRRRFLWNRRLYESILVQSFADTPIDVDLGFRVAADFRDVFEIRGARRQRRGELMASYWGDNAYVLSYRGLDGELRRTAISFSLPVVVDGNTISVPLHLEPRRPCHLRMTISSDGDPTQKSRAAFIAGLKNAKRQARRRIRTLDRITTGNARLNHWLARSAADLALLVTELATGPYPYAGIPWFSVPFGRDALITALQVLWIEPAIARGVLAYLSAAQAAEESTFRDAQPGKIMHETRKGEMARLEEVPFAHYYGGVDTTPLFVLLAGAYWRRTCDREFVRSIWPAVENALAWIDTYGDLDGDGLVEYRRGEDTGLQNQGWKDSGDSIFHRDGRQATGAIALVEVQACVAAAKRMVAEIAEALGKPQTAARLLDEAAASERALEERFWSDEIGTYAIALDGDKRPCLVRSSNAGYVLTFGAAPDHRARQVAHQLMSREFFTGWGIRTLGENEACYNPMSYHNGSVWPHDCSLIAMGFGRYGLTGDACRLFSGLFEAACQLPEYRLPELFCGFRRRAGEAPVAYPSACTPQAWASGAVFLMLQACLGIEIDAVDRLVRVEEPNLPPWLNELTVHDVAIGDARATIGIRRTPHGIAASILEADGEVSLVRSCRPHQGGR